MLAIILLAFLLTTATTTTTTTTTTSGGKETRIIGGTPLTADELKTRYPYAASLQWGGHRCGGTLVASDLVLTAAHCVYVSLHDENNPTPIDPAWFTPSQIKHDHYIPALHTIQLGKLDLRPNNSTSSHYTNNNNTSIEEETLIVEKHIVHPHYNIQTRNDGAPPYPDIALLKLYSRSSSVSQYARLDNPQLSTDWTTFQDTTTTNTSTPNKNHSSYYYQFITMGYGMDETDTISNVLHQTALTYVPNDVCKSMGFWELIHEDMMCASGEGRTDSCNGDSGGPLFWEKVGSDDDDVLQVGLVSWGVGCNDAQYPGVYTRIASHYGWIRTQICLQSKSPPPYYNCPRRSPQSTDNTLPISSTYLVITFQVPPVGIEDYGLLVESLDDLYDDPLLDVKPGTIVTNVGESDVTYALKVQLGHRYRVVLLNTFGRSYGNTWQGTGRILVSWGNEILVDELSQQGHLLVYAIERSFRIANVEGGMSTIDPFEGSATKAPTSKPTEMNLFDLDTKLEKPFITIGSGFHTIDATYVSNLGYEDSTITVEVNVTSDGYAMVSNGVNFFPAKGTAMSLNGSAYVLVNGGTFMGSPLGGYGMLLSDESKSDIMDGVLVGIADANGIYSGAALHVSDNSVVTIRGGEFHSGVNGGNQVPSVEVVDNATVHIYAGSFFGVWDVRDGGSIIVHVCNGILGAESVWVKLLDSSFLDVSFTAESRDRITLSEAECVNESAISKQPTRFLTPFPTPQPTQKPSQLPTTPPVSVSPTFSPSSRPSYALTSPPSTSRTWNTSDFAPESEFESSNDRPVPITTLVPPDCLSMDVSVVCVNANMLTIDETYATTSGFIDGLITYPVHIYNESDVILKAAVTPLTNEDVIQISGSSNFITDVGAEVNGKGNSTGIVFRGQSTGKFTYGTVIVGGENGGTAISVRGGSVLEITGGRYGHNEYDGLNESWTDDADLQPGLSLSVEGQRSRVDVHEGSFVGGWYIGAWAQVYVYGCDFSIEGNLVQGFLTNGTALDVMIKANGQLFFVDECPDVVGGLEEQFGVFWSSDSETNSTSLIRQNASTLSLIDEYSYVIGPIVNTNRIVISLSEDAPYFFIDRPFFAATTSSVIDEFYSVLGKEAYDVQTEIEVVSVRQIGAELKVEITYEQITMYRTRFRAGSLTSDTEIEDIIQGPFIKEEDRDNYIKLLNRNILGLVVTDVTIPEILPDTTVSPAEDESNASTSRLIKSLAAVFIAILICCCGFGVVAVKQMRDKSERSNIDEQAQVVLPMSVSGNNQQRDIVNENENENTAETGIPLVSAYQSFNQDEVSDSPLASAPCLNVPSGCSLSAGTEAMNVVLPPCKLGLRLEYSDSGLPIVQAIEGISVASGYLKVGDHLAFIDGADVRTIGRESIGKMMDEFCTHTRRLTILRKTSESLIRW